MCSHPSDPEQIDPEIPDRRPPLRQPRAVHYVVAVIATTLAGLLTHLLYPLALTDSDPFALFPIAVMIAAWYGGFRPGMLATGLGATWAVAILLAPWGQPFAPGGVVQLLMFLTTGGVISLLTELMHTAHGQADASVHRAEQAFQESQETVNRLARTESALKASEARLRRLIDANIIGIHIGNYDGQVLDANDAYLNMVGYTHADLRAGRINWMAMTAPEYRNISEQAIATLRSDAVCPLFEKEYIRPDGQRISIMLGAAAIHQQNQFICYALDVTRQKRVERELERARQAAESASQAKSDFLANISHELRTPMNAILGMTQLALDEEISPAVHDYLETTKSSADILLGLLNDILDFSKLEAGKFAIDLRPFSLRAMLDETMKALAVRADERKLELTCDVAGDIPEHLVGDPLRLRQIITNLVGNAIKFTPTGEVALHVSLLATTTAGVRLQFVIADTGIGISAEDQERIFAPFTQADTSTTRQFGGTGLGLAISRELIALMGGDLWVESQPGEGSRFYFTSRLTVQTNQRGDWPSQKIVQQLQGMPVLIVDDNGTNRRILEKTLASWAMQPTVAASAEQALSLLQQRSDGEQPFSLAIIDAVMPGTDGFELVEQIQSEPQQVRAAILMLSSADRQTFAPRCEELGVSAFLIKPVSQSDLLEAILETLGLQSPVETPEPARRPARRPGRPLRILLVEDTPANQKVVKIVLARRGHVVDIAFDGQQAVELQQQQNYDLILMDVQMPVMDGFKATTLIRAREKQTDLRVPIVAMTAHAMKGDRERCLAAGMDAYVSKPLNMPRLIEVVESLGGRSELADEGATGLVAEADCRPQSASDGTAFNYSRALQRLGNCQELFQDMVTFFYEGYPTLLESAHNAWQAGDARGVERAAHTLKGLVAGFSSDQVLAAARRVEELASQKDLPEAGDALQHLDHELQQLAEAVETYYHGSSDVPAGWRP